MAGKWLLRRGSRFFAKSSRRRILAVNDPQSLSDFVRRFAE